MDLALTDVAGIVGSVALRRVRRRELNVQNDNAWIKIFKFMEDLHKLDD